MSSEIKAIKSGSDCEQQPMLVAIVKRMETPKDIVSSLVRLYSPDDYLRVIPHAFYFCVKSAFGCLETGSSSTIGNALILSLFPLARTRAQTK